MAVGFYCNSNQMKCAEKIANVYISVNDEGYINGV